jgi:hypothetical protein
MHLERGVAGRITPPLLVFRSVPEEIHFMPRILVYSRVSRSTISDWLWVI